MEQQQERAEAAHHERQRVAVNAVAEPEHDRIQRCEDPEQLVEHEGGAGHARGGERTDEGRASGADGAGGHRRGMDQAWAGGGAKIEADWKPAHRATCLMPDDPPTAPLLTTGERRAALGFYALDSHPACSIRLSLSRLWPPRPSPSPSMGDCSPCWASAQRFPGSRPSSARRSGGKAAMPACVIRPTSISLRA